MRTFLTLAVGIALLAPVTVSAVDITACDQTVPPGETGNLVVDLVCPSSPGSCFDSPSTDCDENTPCPTGACRFPSGVTLEDRATLLLNGLSITGGFTSVYTEGRKHTVLGPGHIEGAVLFRDKLRIADVTVSGGHFGVFSGVLGRLHATNVTVIGTSYIGIRGGLIKGSNLVSIGNDHAGIECERLRADNVTANDNGTMGIACDKIVATNVTTNGNAGAGVHAGRNSRLTNFNASGNGGADYHGYYRGGTLTNATIEDITTARRPRLKGTTTCSGISRQFDESSGPFGTWGVCDGD